MASSKTEESQIVYDHHANAMNLERNSTKVSESDDLNTCNVVRLLRALIYDKDDKAVSSYDTTR